MKKLSDNLFVVDERERITVKVEAIKTLSSVNVSLDGQGFALQDNHFEFQASTERGTTHFLVLVFNFSVTDGAYHVNLKGDTGGSFRFDVSSSGSPVSSRLLEFSVGSAGNTRLGIEPPSPWPEG